MSLVSTDWLSKNLDKVKIIDATWHLEKNRNAIEEYKNEHIENALFFDLDKNSNKNKNLPHGHYLPAINDYEKNISELGILNTDRIIIYCNSNLISSCRAWFQFLYFGHDKKLVSILNGGLKKWKYENRKVTNLKTKIISSKYVARENINMIKTKHQIKMNVKKNDFLLIDARSKNRFLGRAPEPRPGVKSGSIKGSKSLPFNELISLKDNSFLGRKKLKDIFKLLEIDSKEIVMSCGSSVSAATLALAYSLINNDYIPKIYIGSWTEFGKK
tara:strand:+ start:90 stop:905 length:816 start_codon:yes stop_codon:yes gene_type:complete